MFLYAMHDALIKPLPGNDMAPCLAESWKEGADGLTYLRPGLGSRRRSATARSARCSCIRSSA